MIKFYYHPSPNPQKVALFLEEAGLPYEVVPVDTRNGDQHKPEFRKINPNGKTPALTDGDAVLFDSSAILLYLAEKTGKFLPPNTPADRAQLLSWLMFIASGIGPYSGQAVHFKNTAPEKLPYAINRYMFEADRHFGLLEEHLEGRHYMMGDTYTILDMSIWGWRGVMALLFGADVASTKFPNLTRLINEISARPAAVTAAAMREKFNFATGDMTDAQRRNMFPQNYVQAS